MLPDCSVSAGRRTDLKPAVSTKQLDTSVAIPAACRRLAQEVKVPPIAAGDDAIIKIAEHRAALETANAKIRASNACVAELGARYASRARAR